MGGTSQSTPGFFGRSIGDRPGVREWFSEAIVDFWESFHFEYISSVESLDLVQDDLDVLLRHRQRSIPFWPVKAPGHGSPRWSLASGFGAPAAGGAGRFLR